MDTPKLQEPEDSEQLISNEFKEIIGYRPHWVIRKGNWMMFLLLLSFLVASWFVRYPDVISASAHLLATNAPKMVNSKAEGKLIKLLIQNEQPVKKGQHLAYLQSPSPAKHEEVVQLQEWINQTTQLVENKQIESALEKQVPFFYSLGDLQPAFQDFQNVLFEAKQILAAGYYQKKKSALKNDLANLSTLQNNTKEQQKLVQKDYELQKNEYAAKETLLKDKVIAPLEFNQDKSKLIAKEQGLSQIHSQLINNDLASQNKQKEILDLEKSVFDQQQRYQAGLFGLKSKVEEWIQKYIVVAPEAGVAQYTASFQENQLLAMGQEMFYIRPEQTDFYGEVMASQKGFGKIKIGQKVIMKVASYPSSEFGYLTGTVDYISDIPNRRDSFLVKIHLPKGLRTNYDKALLFRNNLYASADIITDNRKLLHRFAGQLKDIWDK